jgi:hypothetical protein
MCVFVSVLVCVPDFLTATVVVTVVVVIVKVVVVVVVTVVVCAPLRCECRRSSSRHARRATVHVWLG